MIDSEKFRKQLQEATRRDVPNPLDQGKVTLNLGEAASTIEMADATRKLEFHESLQLHNLNTPLIEAGLAFPFQPEDIRRADPQECDVLTGTEAVIAPKGSDFAMGLIKSTRGFSPEGKLLTGKFDSIFVNQEAYNARGGKIVVVADKDTSIPDGEVQGRVQVPQGLLQEINGQLTEINRTPLSEDLAGDKPKENVETVTGFEIIPDKSDKSNSFFYNRGHVGLVLHTDSGRSMLMTKNALNDRKEQGSINLVELTDGRYGIVNTVRMLVGAGASYRSEISRGYADVKTAEMTKKMQEKHGEKWTADQVGMELGLAVDQALNIETSELRQDYAYEDATPKLQILTFDKDAVMRTAPGYVQQMMEEFEGLTPKKATAEEVLAVMDKGLMVDAFSMAVFGSRFLEKGIVRINPRYEDANVILERRSMIQLGGQETYVVPQGPAFAKGARTVAQIHPNTGNARFWYQARVAHGNIDLLPSDGRFEKVAVPDVAKKIQKREFSTVDGAVLFRTLYNQRIIIPNI
jgi:hypothetical protein